MSEAEVLRATRLLLANEVPDGVFWRNSTGFADMIGIRKKHLEQWMGKVRASCPGVAEEIRRAMAAAHPMRFGLAPGSSDLIGIAPGGRFVALEAKFGKGKERPEQALFAALVRSKGGLAGTFWSPEEALEILRNR